MRYGEIARRIRQEVSVLNELADELERIESATPVIDRNQTISQKKLLLTVQETAEALSISRPTVYRLIHRDDFPSVRIGSRTYINAKKLQEWLDNQSIVDI